MCSLFRYWPKYGELKMTIAYVIPMVVVSFEQHDDEVPDIFFT